VFMIDSDFSIERPRRVYRHGLHLLQNKMHNNSQWHRDDPVGNAMDDVDDEFDPENPLDRQMAIESGEGKGDRAERLQDEEEHNASQHTFCIINSQRKLKLVAKNAVSLRYDRTSFKLTQGDSGKCISSSCRWSESLLTVFGPGEIVSTRLLLSE